MTFKRPFNIKKLEDKTINQLNQNEELIYAVKLESRVHTGGTATATRILLGQDMETGQAWFSANGSPVTSRTFSFFEKKGTITYATAHVQDVRFSCSVTDVTQSQITIGITPLDQLVTGISSVTTASLSVFWQVVASNF